MGRWTLGVAVRVFNCATAGLNIGFLLEFTSTWVLWLVSSDEAVLNNPYPWRQLLSQFCCLTCGLLILRSTSDSPLPVT